MKKLLMTTVTALGLVAALVPSGAQAQGSGDNFVGQMLTVGFNFCPRGWARADGQLEAISQNEALFSLLGTTYGGDGRTTFGLPERRGRVVIGVGTGPGLSTHNWGQRGGVESVTLNINNLPTHSHTAVFHTSTGNQDGSVATNALLATSSAYTSRGSANVTLNAATVATLATGGQQPIDIRMPYQVVNECIGLFGIYPSRS